MNLEFSLIVEEEDYDITEFNLNSVLALLKYYSGKNPKITLMVNFDDSHEIDDLLFNNKLVDIRVYDVEDDDLIIYNILIDNFCKKIYQSKYN